MSVPTITGRRQFQFAGRNRYNPITCKCLCVCYDCVVICECSVDAIVLCDHCHSDHM